MTRVGRLRISLFATIFMLFISACQSVSDVLSIQQMKKVMWDLIRVDEFVGMYLAKDSTLVKTEEASQRYLQVYQLHKVTEKQVQESLAYYRKQPQLFRELIDSLNIYGNRMRELHFTDTSSATYPKPPTIK